MAEGFGMRKHLFCFGFGFSARALAKRLPGDQWIVTGTSRSDDGVAEIRALGFEAMRFDAIMSFPNDITHIVTSVPPTSSGDPVLSRFADDLKRLAQQIEWCAYLSTTGVYGDHGGGWVDETSPLTPNTERGRKRVAAEQAWQSSGLPVHIFRLAGIYGPERNVLENLKAGTAKRVIKQGQVFSRIHVEDIAGILLASIVKPNPGAAYNVADNMPCPPQDVVAHGAELLGIEPPPEIAFEDAALSPMGASFFADSKRVRNERVKQELGYSFKYPTYREGLKALL
jgi:nucleoside-diphosphate-sugar epimerase